MIEFSFQFIIKIFRQLEIEEFLLKLLFFFMEKKFSNLPDKGYREVKDFIEQKRGLRKISLVDIAE